MGLLVAFGLLLPRSDQKEVFDTRNVEAWTAE
jgi:hypothetical protein